ncbi:MAG: iron-containing alcohol dehydrogenase [bacterium]
MLPNPDISSVREGIELCKRNEIQFILAVGGGSVIDASKAIALGYFYPGDPRDMFCKKTAITQALPLGTILTLAATGSEMDPYLVISDREKQEKRDYGNPIVLPKFSILDPTYTYSVSPKQTVAGIVDIMSHIFEQYFSPTSATEVQDSIAEGLLQTCIYYGHQVIADPENYDARANLMRTSSLALNGLLGLGKQQDRASHNIEHALSAVYNITHGDGLAIIFPRRMEYVL